MLRGVNLGNWLVLEKWMAPSLFAGTEAEDEVALVSALDERHLAERLTVHRDSYVADRDFAYLAARGVGLVRLPLPYFVFGDEPPFVGCIDHVDRAMAWAHKYGIQVLLDLHTVPESQNGFDNGGLSGVCRFHQHPEHVKTALSVLERLAARYGDHPALWGIEVLNEPISPALWAALDVPRRYPAADPKRAEGSEGVPTDFLREFYTEAFGRMRAIAPDLRVVLHDGFRMQEWFGVLDRPPFKDVVIDTHMYVMMAGPSRDLPGYEAYIASAFGDVLQEATKHFPVLVGEWSPDTKSVALPGLDQGDRTAYFERVSRAHLQAFAPAVGWCFWSYKMLADDSQADAWDFVRAVERGYLPLPAPGES